HKSAVKIIAKATKNIAEVMAEAELNRKLIGQTDALEEDWLKVLQDKDYELISSKKRPTLVNIYPDGHGGHLISYARPITTISSLSRKGEPPVLPNFWKTTSVHVDKFGQEISRREFYRSSSLSPFEEKNKEARMAKAEEIAKFEMRQYA